MLINDEENINGCYFTKWQKVLAVSLYAGIQREVISSIGNLEVVHQRRRLWETLCVPAHWEW